MQDVRLHTLVSTVETVRWCIAVIQFSTHQSILLTGRAISMVLEDYHEFMIIFLIRKKELSGITERNPCF